MTSPLPEGITLSESPMPALQIDTAAAQGTVFLNGAHVNAWRPAGHKDVIWCSQESEFAPGKAIRGGVPIVFPWFVAGVDGNLTPNHGCARTAQWSLVSAKVSHRGNAKLHFALDGTKIGCDPAIPSDARLEYHVVMGETLQMQLVVIAGDAPLSCEMGLHTYFAVSDIANVTVSGLTDAPYLDRPTESRGTQHGDVRFDGEYDRMFQSARTTQLKDTGWDRTLLIEKVGSSHTVVWNPAAEKAASLPDMGNDEWPGFVCVEAITMRDDRIRLAPHKRHLLSQTISVL